VYILEIEEECHMSQVDEIWIWHRRMGHLTFDNLIKAGKKGDVKNMPKVIKPSSHVCKHYQVRKQTRVRFKTKEHSTSKPFDIFHTDICGPSRTRIIQGEHYFMLIIDDYMRMTWVYFLKQKYEAFENFKEFKTYVENETYLKINCLILDNGGEFISK
jgi:hypothetical protein